LFNGTHRKERLSHPVTAVNNRRVKDDDFQQTRLLIEELCCDLCRFKHATEEGLPMAAVRIDREFFLGKPEAFADIRVAAGDHAPYFLEVKFGYSFEKLLSRLAFKFASAGPAISGEQKVALVIDTEGRALWPEMERRLRESLDPAFKLEVWDERFLLDLVRDQLGITLTALDPGSLHDVREAIDRAKGFYAFGQDSMEKYVHHPLHAQLIWHLGFWRVKKLREEHGFSPREILPPGLYRKAIDVMFNLLIFNFPFEPNLVLSFGC
jgi:hypothetical protein